MVTVNVDLRHPTQGGTDAPKSGYLECAPTKRRNLGDWVTLPERFTAKLVDGKAVLDLAPTVDGTWAWRITERTNAGARRLVAVPSSGPVEYGDLQDVDPDTLDPTTPVTPVWSQFIHDQIAEAIDGILDGAPAAMDTLAELAAALGDDPNFATTITTALAGKVDTATFTTTINTLTSTVGLKASQAALDAETTARTTADNAKQDKSSLSADVAAKTSDGSALDVSLAAKIAAGITGKQDTSSLNADVASKVAAAGATQTAVDARAALASSPRGRTFQGRQMQPCTARFPIIAAGILSDGVKLTADTETHWPITRDILSASLVFTNLIDFSSSTANANNITVRAGVKIGSSWMPVFFNGRRDVVIEPDGMAISDPVGGPVAAGASLAVRTRVTVASGEKWVNNTLTDNADSEGLIYDTTDKTTNAGTITVQRAYSPAPFTILGEPARPGSTAKRTLVGIGDSIMQQAHDSINASVSATSTLAWGFVRRWAHVQKVPFINTGVIGDTAQGYAATGGRKYTLRRLLATDAAVAISDFGANDLSAGRTLAQIQADLTKIWTDMANIGIEVWQTTITPNTSSTDVWATTGNQTVRAWESVRVALNDWIRTKPAPLTGFIETADAVETSRNSGIWKAPSYTDDGLHPVIAGHAAMAATIPNTII